MKFLLLALILNASTGDYKDGPKVIGAYDTVEACTSAKAAKGVQHPKDGRIVVFTCAAPPGAAIPAAPVEPVEIPDDATRATT